MWPAARTLRAPDFDVERFPVAAQDSTQHTLSHDEARCDVHTGGFWHLDAIYGVREQRHQRVRPWAAEAFGVVLELGKVPRHRAAVFGRGQHENDIYRAKLAL